MVYHQLSPEVGQKRVVVASGANEGAVLQNAGEFPAGQETAANSLPVVLPAADNFLPILPYKEKESIIRSDLFGNARENQALSLFNYTDDYSFREDLYIAEVQGLDELGENDLESAKWAQLQNVNVEYAPVPNGTIRHDPERQAVQIQLGSAQGGFQRVRIATKRRFRYQTGCVVRASVCTQMTLADLPSCEKTWGIGDSFDGFFFRIKADGEGDNFQVLHRRSSGDGLVRENIVSRSNFTHEKLDGTSDSGWTIDFTKNCMYLIEWGWYGASSARFYAFVEDASINLPERLQGSPRGRWVLMHEMAIPDSLDAPSLGTPILPFSLEITNTGYLREPQSLFKYGLSLQIDNGESEKAEMYGADLSDGRDIGPMLGGTVPSHYTPLFAIRSKDIADNNILNSLQALPKTMQLLATAASELVVMRDFEYLDTTEEVGHVNGTLPVSLDGGFSLAEPLLLGPNGDEPARQLLTEIPNPLPLSFTAEYDATKLGTLEANFSLRKAVNGKILTTAFLPPNQGISLNLTPIYDLVRESISTEYDSLFNFPVKNKNIEVLSIDGSGVLTFERKHTFEEGFRFQIGDKFFYIASIPSSTTATLSETRGGSLYNNFTSDGIVAPFFGTIYYDLVIDQAVAARVRPLDQGIVIFAARRIVDSLLVENLGEKAAQWMKEHNCSTTNSYDVLSPAPEVRAFLNYGLR